MNRPTSIALVAVLVVTVAAPLGAASPVTNEETPTGTDETESIAPGEHLIGVVGVQNAELEGDVSERAYSARIANAERNETKAAVLDEHLAESRTRLAELEERLETLNESRESGDLGEGRYRAEVAQVVAEARAVERRIEAAETTATRLPESALADRGVDVESIRATRARVGELAGPEPAAIARSIGGEDVGRSIGAEREPGRPLEGEHGNGTAAPGSDAPPRTNDGASPDSSAG
ncbi:hypothetical protein [Halopiger djelfimassiliensis]|uniref:hypothetical protein n=1 Tax=Halopiger djelfimassiliensis TaxID=1293047 RepID=UPI00067793B5|nr:hypothetical protein [Halopiger djelfimassiliensis]